MGYSDPPNVSPGQVLTDEMWNTYIAGNLQTMFPSGLNWNSYTPELTAATTDPNLGSGETAEGRYWQVGNTVFVNINIIFGSSPNEGSGAYEVSVPANIDSAVSSTAVVGSGYIVDSSAGDRVVVVAHRYGANTVRVVQSDSNDWVKATVPWTWAQSDAIRLHLTYEIA